MCNPRKAGGREEQTVAMKMSYNHVLAETGVGGVFGFWFSLDFVIGGNSEELPGASSFFPPIYTPLGQFENNTAHSNILAGVAMYRNGYRPIEFAYFRWGIP